MFLVFLTKELRSKEPEIEENKNALRHFPVITINEVINEVIRRSRILL